MRRFLALTLFLVISLLIVSCGGNNSAPSQSASEKPRAEDAKLLPDEAAMLAAAIRGDAPAVKALLDKGVNVNAKDNVGRTALTEAAYFGHTEVAKLLLDRGADVFAKKKDGETPLTMAGPHKEIAEMIQRELRLLDVAGKGDNKTLKEFLDKGVYVNMRDPDGRTPLIEAVWYNHADTVKLLLDKGADPNAKKNDGVNPLGVAVAKGYKDIAEMLRKAGAK